MNYRFYETAAGDFAPREFTLSVLMQRQPRTLAPSQMARDALILMHEGGFRHVPIVEPAGEDGLPRLVGLVTETDLLKKVVHGQHLTADERYHATLELMLPLEQIMTRTPHTLPPEASPREAADLMLEQRVRCVPVTGPQGELLGLVTQTDLLSLLRQMLD